MIDVVRAGPLTTVQDGGRPGWAHLGVPPSGAVDRRSLAAANGIVGNDPSAAALEATLAGPALRFATSARVAVTGAAATVSIGGRAVAAGELLDVGAGEVLDVGRCTRGVRVYVAVRGGIDAPATLGSRSTDLLTGLGPPPLRDGDVLRVGAEPDVTPPSDVAPVRVPEEVVLRIRLGPRDDWFAPAALSALVDAAWRVDPASNRVGVRLQGPQLRRAVEDELLSEGVVTGALQVPPSGPILLLHDHPTTGGYPVIAVVRDEDLWLAGQLGPGATVRFALERRL
jgi:biotin-dependent carboxylase-like uncharacterized protein